MSGRAQSGSGVALLWLQCSIELHARHDEHTDPAREDERIDLRINHDIPARDLPTPRVVMLRMAALMSAMTVARPIPTRVFDGNDNGKSRRRH